MKALRLILTITGVMCWLLMLPDTASARSSFYVGIGYHHSNFHRGRHLRHGWYGGHHRWSHHRHYGWWGRGYWDSYWWRPGAGIWIDDWYPYDESVVIVERPGVLREKEVGATTRPWQYVGRYDEKTLELFKRLRARKSELLKVLRLGDKEERIKAIGELAGFSFDDKVREALAEVLLSEPDAELRKEAAKSFGNVKNKVAVSVLEKAKAEDPDKAVREAAAEAIKKIEEY